MTEDELIEKMAKSDADFDGRDWLGMPRWNRQRYCERIRRNLSSLRSAGYEIVPKRHPRRHPGAIGGIGAPEPSSGGHSHPALV